MITCENLRKNFLYNEHTGVFSRRSGRNKDKPLGTPHHDGYIVITIGGKKYNAHRLAWLYVNGYWSENNIDHINRDKSDNRICNLREASHQCNARNSKKRSTNTSGIVGVSFRREIKKWIAQITVNYKNHNLGSFDSKIDAARARWEAEKKHNFPNCNTTSSALEYIKKHKITESS